MARRGTLLVQGQVLLKILGLYAQRQVRFDPCEMRFARATKVNLHSLLLLISIGSTRSSHVLLTKLLAVKYKYLPSATKLRQVIFLQASVIHSVHRGVCQTPPQADIPWAETPSQTLPRADTPLGRHPSAPSACWDTPPTQYMLGYPPAATPADGTHPAGMHSC